MTIRLNDTYVKPFIDEAILCNAAAVITAHNHPYGPFYPTPGDRATNVVVTEGLAAMDGKLYILFESGADKYANGGGTDPTEDVGIMKID